MTRYDDLKFVSRNPTVFSSWKGGSILRELNEQQSEGNRALMITTWTAAARSTGGSCSAVHAADGEEPPRRTCAGSRGEIIDNVAAKGACEFVSEVSAVLPMQVICQMMGVAREDWAPVYDLSNKLCRLRRSRVPEVPTVTARFSPCRCSSTPRAST